MEINNAKLQHNLRTEIKSETERSLKRSELVARCLNEDKIQHRTTQSRNCKNQG
jgi:hypothetical protein